MHIQTQYLNTHSSFAQTISRLLEKRDFKSFSVKIKDNSCATIIFDKTHFLVENIDIKISYNESEEKLGNTFTLETDELTIIEEYISPNKCVISLYPYNNDSLRIGIIMNTGTDTKILQSNFNELNSILERHTAVIDDRGYLRLEYITSMPIKRQFVLKFDERVTVLKEGSKVTNIKRQHGTKLYKLYNIDEVVATIECDNIGFGIQPVKFSL